MEYRIVRYGSKQFAVINAETGHRLGIFDYLRQAMAFQNDVERRVAS